MNEVGESAKREALQAYRSDPVAFAKCIMQELADVKRPRSRAWLDNLENLRHF